MRRGVVCAYQAKAAGSIRLMLSLRPAGYRRQQSLGLNLGTMTLSKTLSVSGSATMAARAAHSAGGNASRLPGS